MSSTVNANPVHIHPEPELGQGIYTIPDAARILSLPATKLRRWLEGYASGSGSDAAFHQGVVTSGHWGNGRESGMNFLAMIELYVFGKLRELKVPAQKIRRAHSELQERFQTPYPFASFQLLSRENAIFAVLDEFHLLELDAKGQMAFQKIIEPFCAKIEFDKDSQQAKAFWPLGPDHQVVVDPGHAFGQPRVVNTNILAEVVAGMVDAGESIDTVADLYEISREAVLDCLTFSHTKAA